MNPLLKEIKEQNNLIKTLEKQHSVLAQPAKKARKQIDDMNKLLDPLYLNTWSGNDISEEEIKTIIKYQKERTILNETYYQQLADMQKISDDIDTKKLYVKKLYNELNDLLENSKI